jgi:hypothetical protein
MQLKHAIELRNLLRQNKVIMAYNGAVSDELMLTLADMLKARLIAHDDSKRSKLIFSVFMEGVQNLIWHGSGQDDDAGMILITEFNNEITIMCGNRIQKNETHALKERLHQIEGADKETIRQLYREGMSHASDHQGPGAGLGLLEIARRSTHPISYTFEEVDDKNVDFILSATI